MYRTAPGSYSRPHSTHCSFMGFVTGMTSRPSSDQLSSAEARDAVQPLHAETSSSISMNSSTP